MTAPPLAVDVIVVAAGSSNRMAGLDKILTPIHGRPLLAWTLGAFAAVPSVARIVVVGSSATLDTLRDAPWVPERVTQYVLGGGRRQDSVANGFEVLQATTRGHEAGDRIDRVVLVHDGARPVVSRRLIESVATAAARFGAAIPLLPIAETVKRVDGDVVAGTIDRSTLGTAQTPQGVRGELLAEAYRRFPPDGPDTFTDEAALLEACRIPVHVVPGEPTNLKVTVPADLARAADLLQPAPGTRHGIGHDSHPFGPGEPLRLGGVVFDGVPQLAGHSDGDVALHAVADALLGAAGLGDLGRLYPAGAGTPVGIDSGVMLATVVEQLAAAGSRPATIDLTIVAARPRLGDRLDAMRAAIAGQLGIDASAVSVKASTGNLDGSEGAGRTISALALAAIETRP